MGLVILSGIHNPILIDEAHREGQIFTLLLVDSSTLLSNKEKVSWSVETFFF